MRRVGPLHVEREPDDPVVLPVIVVDRVPSVRFADLVARCGDAIQFTGARLIVVVSDGLLDAWTDAIVTHHLGPFLGQRNQWS